VKLQFVKNEGKPHVIRYYRDDGTQTWMQADDFFIRHDLSHFAVESTLGYKTAFYGMINAGTELSDFTDREKRAALVLTREAVHAESLANLFLMDLSQGRVEDFDKMQQQAMTTSFSGTQPVSLSHEQINAVRKALSGLLLQWRKLSAGQSLLLEIAL
jgi:hypothetical protein